jgi:hypothetical protein
MHDVVAMCGAERGGELQQDLRDRVDRQRSALLAEVGQRPTLDVRHDEGRPSISGTPGAVDHDDVRIVDRARCPCLTEEPGDHVTVLNVRGRDDLDREAVTGEIIGVCLPDLAHAAGADHPAEGQGDVQHAVLQVARLRGFLLGYRLPVVRDHGGVSLHACGRRSGPCGALVLYPASRGNRPFRSRASGSDVAPMSTATCARSRAAPPRQSHPRFASRSPVARSPRRPRCS